jgi:hypothetical protein
MRLPVLVNHICGGEYEILLNRIWRGEVALGKICANNMVHKVMSVAAMISATRLHLFSEILPPVHRSEF